MIKHCFERFCLFSRIPTAQYKCLHLPFHLQNKGGAASFEMKPLRSIDVEQHSGAGQKNLFSLTVIINYCICASD